MSGKSLMGWRGFCLLSVLVLGCGDGGQGVVVEEAWVRENIAPLEVTAGYLVVRNGGEATALVSAKTDVAAVTELHVMTVQDDVMRMRKVAEIPIPEHGVTALEPGGSHLMLIGLTRDLVVGEEIGLVLEFANGQTIEVKAVVKEVGGHG